MYKIGHKIPNAAWGKSLSQFKTSLETFFFTSAYSELLLTFHRHWMLSFFFSFFFAVFFVVVVATE